MATKSAVRTKRASKPVKRTAPAPKTARGRSTAKPTKRAARPSSAAVATRPKPRAVNGAKSDFSIDKLCQVALQASNLDEAVAFYRDILGLRFITRYDPPGLAFFDMGAGFRLMLSATASEATLYFRVADINNSVKALKKRGVSFLQPPAMIYKDENGDFGKKGTEEWMAFFKDPSGNILALTERR